MCVFVCCLCCKLILGQPVGVHMCECVCLCMCSQLVTFRDTVREWIVARIKGQRPIEVCCQVHRCCPYYRGDRTGRCPLRFHLESEACWVCWWMGADSWCVCRTDPSAYRRRSSVGGCGFIVVCMLCRLLSIHRLRSSGVWCVLVGPWLLSMLQAYPRATCRGTDAGGRTARVYDHRPDIIMDHCRVGIQSRNVYNDYTIDIYICMCIYIYVCIY